MDFKNWILKKYSNEIKIVFTDYEPHYLDFLVSRGIYANIDLSKVETFIDWIKYPCYYSFWYYFQGCEKNVLDRLKSSPLAKHKSVLMDFGIGNPICEIPIKVFIDNWIDFVVGTLYTSTTVTTDGELVMEFVKGDYLNSNFSI